MKFTNREEDINEATALGYTPDEIGDLFTISRETVRKIICNIKAKVKRQKSTELSAEYWCKKCNTTLEDERRKFLDKIRERKETIAIVIVVLFFTGFQIQDDKIRTRIRYRRQDTESVVTYSTL